jgi:two-component system OmpR family response regulator
MKKVLVIEDETALRNNICEILQHFEFIVACSETGEQAIEIASEFLPHVIICDIMLPGMDGYQVLGEIRKNADLNKTAFIFLTAKATNADVRAGMNLGADDYLTKPFRKEELLDAVNTRLSRILNLSPHETEQIKMNPEVARVFDEAIAKLDSVSKAELKVVQLMSAGHTSQLIADKLFLSRKTVENHRANISKKLGLKGPNSLISFVFYIRGKNLIKQEAVWSL